MGLTLFLFLCLALSGGFGRWQRLGGKGCQQIAGRWRSLHIGLGGLLVTTVLLLLAIGLVGSWGEHHSWGHSSHLWAGCSVVVLVIFSAIAGLRSRGGDRWRVWHLGANGCLLLALLWVLLSGWQVVQPYLPPDFSF